MGNCCSSTATVPSSPPPRATEMEILAPVLSPSTGRSSIPSSKPLSRTCSRTASKPESTHNRMPSQYPNSRGRTKSAPQASQSSKSSSLQNPSQRIRTQSVSGTKRSNHSDSRPTNPEQVTVVAPATTKSNPSGSRSHASTAALGRGKKSRNRRSSALRASRDIFVEASIKAGQSGDAGNWRRLWSRLDFADQSIKNCANILHVNIVEIWEQNDGNNVNYLSSDQFKINMSHVVKDLAMSASHVSPSTNWNRSGDTKFANWVYDVFRGSQENVRCLMGYIVDLHVILNEISKTSTSNVTGDEALEVINNHVRSDRRSNIHQEIRSFVTEKFPKRYSDPTKDLFLEKIINLIRQYYPQ